MRSPEGAPVRSVSDCLMMTVRALTDEHHELAKVSITMKHGAGDREQVYLRSLPGGGYVAIEVTPARGLLGQRSYHGDVVVERRIQKERRNGHRPPIVADVDSPTISGVIHALFLVAHSNTLVASGCLERTRQREKSSPMRVAPFVP